MAMGKKLKEKTEEAIKPSPQEKSAPVTSVEVEILLKPIMEGDYYGMYAPHIERDNYSDEE